MAEIEFWKRSSVNDNGCWIWSGPEWNGYGFVYFNGKTQRVHRLAWKLFNKKEINNKCVCHTCDNPLCINPAHLWLGSQKENMQDRVDKGRKLKQRDYKFNSK